MQKLLILFVLLSLLMPQYAFAEPFTSYSAKNAYRIEQYYEQARSLYGEYDSQGSLNTSESTYPEFDFSSTPTLSIRNNDFYANDQRIQGIFVNWFIHAKTVNRAFFKREFRAMKEAGIIGVSLELPWADSEMSEDVYVFPEYLDAAIEEAASEGLWVSVLLSPHYAPEWIYEKYCDVYLYDNQGKKHFWNNFGTHVDEQASYINFSIHSPVIEDQIEWQQEAVKHFSKHPNLFNFYLGNEQIYNKEVFIDYSKWAEEAWSTWLKQQNFSEYALPQSPTDDQFVLWQEFRSQALNAYMSKVHKQVTSALPRFIPVGQRLLLYHSFSSEAVMYGYQPGQFELAMDFLGNDNYSFAPSVYPAQLSFDKPIMLGETSLQSRWDAEGMYQFLMTQFYLGADIQSVYVWNKKPYDYALTNIAGDLTEKGEGVARAAQEINAIQAMTDGERFQQKQPKILIVLPNDQFLTHADDFKSYQYKLDDIFDTLLEHGILASYIWESDLHTEIAATIDYVNQFNFILLPFTGDYMRASVFYKWVNKGGIAYKTVLFEYEQEQLGKYQEQPDQTSSPYGCIQYQQGEICTMKSLNSKLFQRDVILNLSKYPVRLLHLIYRHIPEFHSIQR